MSDVVVQPRGDAVRFSVRVQPRAFRAGVDGVQMGALRVKLSASPVDGAANDELVKLLADLLDVSKSHVRIVSGASSRTKLIEVDGVDAERVRALAERG
jgi:uncharacterized protein (TIGR00251 family)